MRTLFLSEGHAFTDEEFRQSALESPLSAWQTFGFGIKAGFEPSVFGTMAREAQTPDPARVPVAGGRGGVNWRFETPAEVEARGDTLYKTADDYKASPFYRENVPFEPGMTESRAKALAEQTDLRSIRDYYSAKRPITSALGQFVGAGLAPENYIPVLGEWAAAATTARVGKVAGRALLTSADAALNTGAFQLLTREERRQLGDDTSWQAIFENMAFAAAAGGVLGGLRGGFDAVRGRYTAPALETAPAASPESRQAVSQPTSVEPNAPLPETGFRLDLPESGSARFSPEWRVAANVLDRVETPAARAKSAAVMNDAASGLAVDGEIRLGEQSRVNLDELRRVVADAAPDPTNLRAAIRDPDTGQMIIGAVGETHANLISRLGFLAAGKIDVKDIAFADARTGQFLSEAEAVQRLPEYGLAPADLRAAAKALGETNGNEFESIRGGMASEELVKAQQMKAAAAAAPEALTGTASDFTVPAPEPALPQLSASYKLVDSLPRAATPEETRLIESAKAEGFDPETGTHDLEPDIGILRERGALTADEEAAIAAADETFAAAKAWGEVAEQLITCKASGA